MANFLKGVPHLEVQTQLDGRPAVLAVHQTGDPGIFDEFDINLITDEGTMGLALVGIETNRDEPEHASEVHVYSYLTNGEEVAAGVSLRPSTGKGRIYVEDHDYEYGVETIDTSFTLDEEGMKANIWQDTTPADLDGPGVKEDFEGFVASLVQTFAQYDHTRYGYLTKPKAGIHVREVGPYVFVGQNDRWWNVTGDSLGLVAKCVTDLVNGAANLFKSVPTSVLDDLEAKVNERDEAEGMDR